MDGFSGKLIAGFADRYSIRVSSKFAQKIAMTIACAAFACMVGCATSSTEGSGEGSEFAAFDESGTSTTTDSAETSTQAEDSLESEMNDAQGPAQQQAEQEPAKEVTKDSADEFAAFEEKKEEPQAQVPPPEVLPESIAIEPEPAPLPVAVVEEPVPVPQVQAPPPVSREKLTQIQRILFKSNDGGGTIAVEADAPMSFTTRTNVNTNQYVIEIPNARLSKKARRSLNTKDFPGGIGSIDPYQAPGSTTARIVIQMRSGGTEPVVQAEGHALLIMAANSVAETTAQAPPPPTIPEAQGGAVQTLSEDSGVTEMTQESKLLSSGSLEEFLGSNQQFYGKKISIEANDAEIRDVIKFISDESGVNLVLNEDVKGRVSIKLKQIPWDQALVVIMKSKRLGYARQGQILRIAKVDDIKKEEEDFARISKVKQSTLPLYVKMIPVSYAKVSELVGQVQPFLSERGKVIAEARTSAIVISDIQESIEKVQKLIASLDIPPAQVLIEGKIVEARETFSRSIGLNWQTSGQSIDFGSNSAGVKQTINATKFSSATAKAAGTGNLTFTLGTLDLLGDLSATLALSEATGDVRVLSSPRILTLHNEAAEISQNSQIPQFTTVASTTGNLTNVSYKDVKLKLSVTPQVTNDASVIMSVDVNRDFLGEDFASGTSSARSVNSRAAKTKVIVRNGQTAVIGGIYQNDSSVGEVKVPVLADIPFLGWLFKSRGITREKNELMIFLTPRIVGQADSGISAPIPLGNGGNNNGNSNGSSIPAPELKSSEAPQPSDAPADGGLEL